jgi:hypothetical protein
MKCLFSEVSVFGTNCQRTVYWEMHEKTHHFTAFLLDTSVGTVLSCATDMCSFDMKRHLEIGGFALVAALVFQVMRWAVVIIKIAGIN